MSNRTPASPNQLPSQLKQRLLAGSTVVQSLNDDVRYSCRGLTSCRLAALNAVRLVLTQERLIGPGWALLEAIEDEGALEEVMLICTCGSSADCPDDVGIRTLQSLPLFEHSLKNVVGKPTPPHTSNNDLSSWLHRLETMSESQSPMTGPSTSSHSVIISGYSDVLSITYIPIQHPTLHGVFAVFDSQPRPARAIKGPSFIFSHSAERVSAYLTQLFRESHKTLTHDSAKMTTDFFTISPAFSADSEVIAAYAANLKLCELTTEVDDLRSTIRVQKGKAVDPSASAPNIGGRHPAETKLFAAEELIKALRAEKEGAYFESQNQLRDANRELQRLRHQLNDRTTALQTTQRDLLAVQQGNIQLRQELADLRTLSDEAKRQRDDLSRNLDVQQNHHVTQLQALTAEHQRQRIELMQTQRTSLDEIASLTRRVHELEDRRTIPPAQDPVPPVEDVRVDPRSPESGQETPVRRPTLEENEMLLWQLLAEENAVQDAIELHHVIDFDGNVGQQLQILNEEAHRASPVQIVPEEEPEVLSDTPKFSCNVCLDEHPLEDVAVVEGCGHEFCRDCMKDFIESKLSDGQYPVMCPICQASRDNTGAPRGYVGRYLIDQLGFTQEQYNKWIELELNQHSMTLECRRCGSSSLVSREDFISAEIFHCPSSECDHVWCKRCGKTIEAAEDDEDDDVSHSCDGSTEFARLMSHSGWKACPGCETPIEKTEGCNHITCQVSGCNTHFCYKCGETIIRSTDNTEISAAWRSHFSADCPLYGE